MNWNILTCPPELTLRVQAWDEFDLWCATQVVNDVVTCVMPGFVFCKADDYLPLRRTVPRSFNVRAYKLGTDQRPKRIEPDVMAEMVEKLSQTPIPNPMKRDDPVVFNAGPWKRQGGEVVRIVSPRIVRVAMGNEHVSVPRCFIRRS